MKQVIRVDEKMSVEEDKLKLCDESSSRGRKIAIGATNAILKINYEVIAALLAGCLFTIIVVVVLTLVPAICAFDSCWCDDEQTTTNVYFIKYEERRWTKDELCWIEIAARRYSQFNILMINVMKDDIETNNIVVEELFGNEILRKTSKSDERLRLLEIPNVRNIDIGLSKFFERSILSETLSNNSTIEEIELAAKFQIIWNSSGISLEPRNVAQLESLLYFFDDQIDTTATIQIDEDLQAASVPCQSFIGLIINEMVRDFADRRTIVKRAITNYCPSLTNCAGVRIIEVKPTQTADFTQCPIVNSYNVDDNQ